MLLSALKLNTGHKLGDVKSPNMDVIPGYTGLLVGIWAILILFVWMPKATFVCFYLASDLLWSCEWWQYSLRSKGGSSRRCKVSSISFLPTMNTGFLFAERLYPSLGLMNRATKCKKVTLSYNGHLMNILLSCPFWSYLIRKWIKSSFIQMSLGSSVNTQSRSKS